MFAEDAIRTGGIGQQLGFALQQAGWQGKYLLHAVDNSHLLHASVAELRKDQNLDAAALGCGRLACISKENPSMSKIRLDQYLCQNGLVQSRERAKALIMSALYLWTSRRWIRPVR